MSSDDTYLGYPITRVPPVRDLAHERMWARASVKAWRRAYCADLDENWRRMINACREQARRSRE